MAIMSIFTKLASHMAYHNCPLQQLNLAGYGQLWLRAEHIKFATGYQALAGNKYWKLLGYLQGYAAVGGLQAQTPLLSYGGVHSNHLWALATVSHLLGVPSIGLVRSAQQGVGSTTLQALSELGMQLYMLTPAEYRQRHGDGAAHLAAQFAHCYAIPEGGNGPLAALGLQQWAGQLELQLTAQFGAGSPVTMACALGTGATFVNLAKYLPSHIHMLGLQVYKDAGLAERIAHSLTNIRTSSTYTLLPWQKRQIGEANANLGQLASQLPLDPVYTGPLLKALLENGYLGQAQPLVMLHTGGLR